MSEHHDWILAAPWYRWPRQQRELELAPRETKPVLQKYEDAKFVASFLADPQRSLVWNDDDWVYETSVLTAATVASGPNKGRVAEPSVKRGTRFERYLATKTSLRKLFLPTHKRFYLVVCELHCDVPGFPRARRDEVCQAGLVVRRRYTTYPAAVEAEAAAILKELSLLQLELAKLERRPAAKRALRRWESFPAPNANGKVKQRKHELQTAIWRQRKVLRAWASGRGVHSTHLGWIESERPGVGAWEVVDEEPQTLLEDVFPLFPLVPSPTDTDNSGQGSMIYFGVVPTGSSDHDELGRPRFDDRHLYEVRCFVRRHEPGCPRKEEPNDCNGELFWSKPTEAFRLAAHFDPVGTSHRPIDVVLPDFPALAAQVANRPVGALSPVKMTQPSRSSLKFDPGVPPSGGSVGDGQICFLAIPLVTIVAWFVLNLFLPIVTFLFGLWFLLRLKFCLPPSLSISAAVESELAVAAQFSLDVDVDVRLDLGFDAGAVHDGLADDLAAALAGGMPQHGATKAALAAYSTKPLAALADAGKPQRGPDFSTAGLAAAPGSGETAGLVWEPRVERSEVLVA